jgi:hypothetical protein
LIELLSLNKSWKNFFILLNLGVIS